MSLATPQVSPQWYMLHSCGGKFSAGEDPLRQRYEVPPILLDVRRPSQLVHLRRHHRRRQRHRDGQLALVAEHRHQLQELLVPKGKLTRCYREAIMQCIGCLRC